MSLAQWNLIWAIVLEQSPRALYGPRSSPLASGSWEGSSARVKRSKGTVRGLRATATYQPEWTHFTISVTTTTVLVHSSWMLEIPKNCQLISISWLHLRSAWRKAPSTKPHIDCQLSPLHGQSYSDSPGPTPVPLLEPRLQ